MGKPKLATVWLEGCSGCHMSFLDLDEKLLGLLSKIQITVSPITDFKDFAFPEVDIGIIEGGIGNEEQAEIAHQLRRQCKSVVAWGDCAVFGGINTLRNGIPGDEVLRRGFIESESTIQGFLPANEELPALLDRVHPLHDLVHVDVFVPGCPPSPEAIAFSVTETLQGRLTVLPRELIRFD